MGSDWVTQGFIQVDLESFPRRRWHINSGQPAALLSCPPDEKVFPSRNLCFTFSLLSLIPITDCGGKPDCLQIGIGELLLGSPKLSLLHNKQVQFPQPPLTGQVLQPSHLQWPLLNSTLSMSFLFQGRRRQIWTQPFRYGLVNTD